MPITITHAKSDTIADWSGVVTVGNSTGGSSTVQASNLVRPSDWNSAHQATLALTGSEIAGLFMFNNGLSYTTDASGITAGFITDDYFEPYPAMNTNSSLSAPGLGTWYIHPFGIDFCINSGQIHMLMAGGVPFVHGHVYSAASTGSVSRSQTLMNRIAMYKRGTGASTTRIESIWSANCDIFATWDRRLSTANTSSGTIFNAVTVSFPGQWDASGGVTYSSTSQSGTTAITTSTMASTRADGLVSGAGAYISGSRMDMFGFATSLPPGNYWFAHMMSTSTSSSGTPGGLSTANTMIPINSRIYMLEFVDQAYKRLGLSVSNATSLVDPWHGSVATTSSLPFANLGTVDMRNQATNARVYWHFMKSNY